MPRYLTQHTLACLTRQGAEALAQRMQAGGTARAERVLVNMLKEKCSSSSAPTPAKLSKAGSKRKACISIGSSALNGRCSKAGSSPLAKTS